MVIYPHDTSFQAVFGVPQLAPQRKVTLDKAMALEVEVKCMTLDISSASALDTLKLNVGIDVFRTSGSCSLGSTRLIPKIGFLGLMKPI
jgi:hypothetical protein